MSIVTTVEKAYAKKQRWGIVTHGEHWGNELRLGRFSAFFTNVWHPTYADWYGRHSDGGHIWLVMWRRFYVTFWHKKNLL